MQVPVRLVYTVEQAHRLLPRMNRTLIPLALLSLALASCSSVPYDPDAEIDINGRVIPSKPVTQAPEKSADKPVVVTKPEEPKSFDGEPQEGIEAAWERQMAVISSEGSESYVLSKEAVVHNISKIMSDCANSLKIHGRNGMGKQECADFIAYQERYNDFSALFILTAMYQKDFVDNPVESNTSFSYPAQSVLKQAYNAHENYEYIVGRP